MERLAEGGEKWGPSGFRPRGGAGNWSVGGDESLNAGGVCVERFLED